MGIIPYMGLYSLLYCCGVVHQPHRLDIWMGGQTSGSWEKPKIRSPLRSRKYLHVCCSSGNGNVRLGLQRSKPEEGVEMIENDRKISDKGSKIPKKLLEDWWNDWKIFGNSWMTSEKRLKDVSILCKNEIRHTPT